MPQYCKSNIFVVFMLCFPHLYVWYRVSSATTWSLSRCQVHAPVRTCGNPAWTTIRSTIGNPLTLLQNLGTWTESRRSHSKKLQCSLLLELEFIAASTKWECEFNCIYFCSSSIPLYRKLIGEKMLNPAVRSNSMEHLETKSLPSRSPPNTPNW